MAQSLAGYGVEVVAEEDRILDWVMPHHGPATSPRCQQVGVVAHFPSKARGKTHWRKYAHDCQQYDCGSCKSVPAWPASKGYDIKGWEAREARAIAHRLEAKRKLEPLDQYPVHPRYSWTKKKRLRKGRQARVYHVVASPPQDWAKKTMWTLPGVRRLWETLYMVLKGRGVVGGVAIFHPARIPSRWNSRSACSDGPHWHVLGFMRWGDAWDGRVAQILHTGGIVPGKSGIRSRLLETGAIRPKTEYVAGDNWVVKVLDSRKRNLYATAAYILSHAGRPIVADMAAGPHQTPQDARTFRTLPGTQSYILEAPAAADAGWAPKAPYPASPRSTEGTERGVQPQSTPPPGRWLGTATRPVGHVPHWFGSCSYNRLKVPDEPDGGVKCPVCGEEVPMDEWWKVVWADPENPPPHGASGESPSDAWDMEPGLSERVDFWASRHQDQRGAVFRELQGAYQ